MSTSYHENLFADTIDGCVVEFLDTDGIDKAAYVCGKCSVIAARADGMTFTAEAECEQLLFDAPDHDFSEE